MIDDKKIEEAARNYCNNRYPSSQDAPFIAEAFRQGANWAINELYDYGNSRNLDKTNVIFKAINNMEIKNNQLTIEIPEGYEIDKKNSTFECIKFKPIKKYLTYKEIAEKLNKDICFFIAKGKIQSYAQYASYDNPGVANSYRQIEKILAINQLMNIAKYYNGDWEPDWSNKKEPKFYIAFDTESSFYEVRCGYIMSCHIIYFKNRKDAQAVIDNPNFRDILDAIYKN